MSYKIKEDDCTNCGVCVSECAVDAIAEKNGKHSIDSDKCIDCGACVGVCPTEAIVEG